MTGGFLLISPALRTNVIQGYSALVFTLNEFTPWSYIAIGVGIFVLLTVELYRHAIPKNTNRPPEY
ncbi:MAG TPA: hypothetical protein VG456_22625 [Candidatus Sulfopaludibacter sp.]|jgi:hypothetical protein|nr:hypothetical protein [Candidatus Sulfopaludibacter sp.]